MSHQASFIPASTEVIPQSLRASPDCQNLEVMCYSGALNVLTPFLLEREYTMLGCFRGKELGSMLGRKRRKRLFVLLQNLYLSNKVKLSNRPQMWSFATITARLFVSQVFYSRNSTDCTVSKMKFFVLAMEHDMWSMDLRQRNDRSD